MSTAFAWNRDHVGHSSPFHPERPDRLRSIIDHLQEHGLWDRLDHRMAAPASREDALLVHTPEYLDALAISVARGSPLDPDTYASPASLDIAYSALGCVLEVTGAVVKGEATSAFAAVRPPGHHATPSSAMGFCLLSNAAIAARWAQIHYDIERVAIVDFDVHHGNGTQDAFYEDGSVLYLSTHQAFIYPGTGLPEEVGHGAGLRTTLNVPLPRGSGDEAMIDAFERIFEPAIDEFKPDLLIASAGYDAHWRDPLAGMNATVRGFARLTRILLEWADRWCEGRFVGVLEGGYDLEALSASVQATILTMLEPNAVVTDGLGSPK